MGYLEKVMKRVIVRVNYILLMHLLREIKILRSFCAFGRYITPFVQNVQKVPFC